MRRFRSDVAPTELVLFFCGSGYKDVAPTELRCFAHCKVNPDCGRRLGHLVVALRYF
jgi:hypothetical protein